MKTIFSLLGILLISAVATWSWYGGFKRINPVIIPSNGFFLVSEVCADHEEPCKHQWGSISSTLEKCISCTSSLPTVYFKYTDYNKNEFNKGEFFYGVLIKDNSPTFSIKEANNIRVMRVEGGNLLSVSSPYKGKLSVAFAIMRAYPALRLFCAENNLPMDKPILEIYNPEEERIDICMVLSNIDDILK